MAVDRSDKEGTAPAQNAGLGGALSTDANRLTEFGLAVLREQYGDLCSEACMRERAATFAENLIRGRSKGTARPNGLECEDRRVAAYGSLVGSST